MTSRLKQFIPRFAPQKLDAFLVLRDVNIRYLTGIPAEDAWLLVTPKRSFYLTDGRYVEAVKRALSGRSVQLVPVTRSLSVGLVEFLVRHRLRRVGFSPDQVTLAQFRQLERILPKGARLIPAPGMVESLRITKSPQEVAQIRESLKIHRQALTYLKRIVRPGRSEREIFLRLEHFVHQRGVDFSFPPIIASGPNSAFPHARITDRRLKAHEPVMIDMGIDREGYKSDLTRMFFFDKIPNLVKDTAEVVRDAQETAIRAVRPGVKAAEVDQQARNYLRQYKLDRFFVHSLGHGVGLDIHEAPRIGQHQNTKLTAGMVITIEPAVYLPGRFGIRIEDMVLVTEGGAEVL